MITIIIFAIIGLVTGIILNRKYKTQIIQPLVISFSLLGIILRKKHQFKITFLFIVYSSILGYFIALALPVKTKTIVDTYKLVNISEIDCSKGNYFLDIQNINEIVKDVFYYEINNEFRMMETDFVNTTIKYSDYPKFERYKQIKEKTFINYFALDRPVVIRYIIYLPKGTIHIK